MKYIKILTFLFVLFSFWGCEDENISSHCPKCNMPIPEDNIHTSTLDKNSKLYRFDDVGCMILWAKEQNIDLKKVKTQIFTNDTKEFIDSFDAYYTINEITPMMYGFTAYKNKKPFSIGFDEVILRMLRGEHMANPKIRKKILGE